MTDRVVAAIDQGTTSTRCLLFNPAEVGEVECRLTVETKLLGG